MELRLPPPDTAGVPAWDTILHLSDLHISAGDDDVLAELAEVVDQYRHATILVTGDLSADGSLESYDKIRLVLYRGRVASERALTDTGGGVVVCGGNHDDLAVIASVFGERNMSVVDHEHFRLITLESSIPGSVWGRLDRADLDRLDGLLGERDVAHLVATHHPPRRLHGHALDQILLDEPSTRALESLARRHANLTTVVCGHLHQGMVTTWGSCTVVVAPSFRYSMRRCVDGMEYGGPGGYAVHHVAHSSVSTRFETSGTYTATEETIRSRQRRRAN